MRIANGWRDYELLDASDGERLERWGNFCVVRPDPQVIWTTDKKDRRWREFAGRYHRSETGGGRWEDRGMPAQSQISYGGYKFVIKPMGFKHMGIFPEQAVNWDYAAAKLKNRPGARVLNLFAYTGGATVACLAAGAQVTHVDASKGMIAMAKENAALSGVAEAPVRWIADDCLAFVLREQRRGKVYDAIICDPPSYGRGSGSQVWKLEDDLFTFCAECAKLLSDDPIFFILNMYTTALAPSVGGQILSLTAGAAAKSRTSSDEIGLPIVSGGVLPCGNTTITEFIR